MQLTIQIKDESKLDFLLQFFRETSFVEVLSMPKSANGKAVGKSPRKKKLTPRQQEYVDGIKESLKQVELHLQGKIKLPTLEEALAEL